jgi:UDP-N-acetylmuramate--alanine ligase
MAEQHSSPKHIHFIGIGGISMSSLAAISNRMGMSVSGSDRAASFLTEHLSEMGVKVFIGQCKKNLDGLPDTATVVYTAAIAPENPELSSARERGLVCMTRAEFLGELMKHYGKRLGIAGTHGKSTTTAMTALICDAAESDPTVVNGAIMSEYDSAYKVGKHDYFVFEACEYTDSFLSFFPTTAIVTNVDFDHADYFHSDAQYAESFAKYIALAEIAVVNTDLDNAKASVKGYRGKLVTVSAENDADYTAENIESRGGFASFDIVRRGEKLTRVNLNVPGLHNVSDALCAAAAAIENGICTDAVKRGLERFRGIKRRIEFIAEKEGIKLFDDYAHHPAEITASLSALKPLGKRLICIYQPHSVSRTAELFDDFTVSFGAADKVIFTDIYENLEHDTGEAGVTSADLAAKVENSIYIGDFDEIAERVINIMTEGDVIATMGAGDVFKVGYKLKDKFFGGR